MCTTGGVAPHEQSVDQRIKKDRYGPHRELKGYTVLSKITMIIIHADRISNRIMSAWRHEPPTDFRHTVTHFTSPPY